jgi:hypothetical protein
MDEEIKEKLSDTGTWLRGLYMLLFIFILGLTKFVVGALVIFQFFNSLFTGSANERLVDFGQNLAEYISQTVLFLCYSSEEKPFPFNDWPSQHARKRTPAAKKKTSKKTSTKSEQETNPIPDTKEGDEPVNYQ